MPLAILHSANKTTSGHCHLLGLVSLILALSGCASHVKVSGNYPQPLITPLPVTAGLVLDSDFTGFIYQEDLEDRWSRTIELGESQAELLRTVLPAVFNEVTENTALPEFPARNAQIWLHPQIQELQYATPRETRLKLFEVWIKYGIKAYDSEGQLLADWIVTAYGKTPSAFMKSEEDALNAALVVALRDLGANLSLQTRQVPEIRDWLQAHNAGESQ